MKHFYTLILTSCLILAGCNEQKLYSQLSEHEANEIVALMYSAGLNAHKVSDKDKSYSVTTSKNVFPQAMSLLRANDLPRKRFESLGDVFEKEGFVSSPLEERARLNHALSQEMSNTLSSIDGVVVARVHLTLPRRNELSNEIVSSSAAVFIKHRSDVDLDHSVAKIKALVVDGVENLKYDDVTVVFFPEMPVTLPALTDERQIPARGAGYQIAHMQFVDPSGLVFLGLLLLFAGLTYWIIALRSQRRSRRKVSSIRRGLEP